MDTVDIKYRSLPFLRIHSTIRRIIPAKWQEASENHLLSVSRYLCFRINERDFIAEFLNIPGRIARKFTDFEVWNIEQCIKLIDEEGPLNRFLIKELKCGSRILKTPKTMLKNVTFGSFVMFDSLYMDYTSGRTIVLDKFIAYLCGIKEDELEAVLEELSGVQYPTKHALVLNYQLVREWLGKRYTYLFMRSSEGKKKDKQQNWLPILDSLIANDLANAEKFEQLPVHTVLRKLDNQIKQYYKHG